MSNFPLKRTNKGVMNITFTLMVTHSSFMLSQRTSK